MQRGLEESFRHAVDGLRADLGDRIDQLRGSTDRHEARLESVDRTLTAAKEDVRVVSHNFKNHLHSHPGPTILPRLTGSPDEKPSKAFVAGVVAAIVVLAGLAQGAMQFVDAIVQWSKR